MKQFDKKVAFYTLGCKVNQYETEAMKKQFLEKGYKEVDFEEAADIYIVNTCTVTSIADRKNRNMLRRAKKNNPMAIVAATGCYVQTNHKEIEKIEEVDYIIGNTLKHRIAEEIELMRDRKSKVESIYNETDFLETGFSTLREMTRAYIKIQDGCNNYCSYCKIPYARGNSRSRKPENIYREAEILSKEGYKEIILIGINLGEYGKENKNSPLLEDIIENISLIEGIERIRIGSVYPDRINDRFIKMLSENKKMMPHLHISMQSADNEILKKMGRKYTVQYMEKCFENLRNNIKGISLTADIITGFPSEKEENFKNTFEFLEKSGFSNLHIFQYSERENTKAALFEDKVPDKIKKERADLLENLRLKLNRDYVDRFNDIEMEVLIEEKDNKGNAYGYSENYIRVCIENYNGEINKIEKIKIKKTEKELLIGGLR